LGTLLPLCFISDVFPIGGELPTVLQRIGDVFPLKHIVHSLLAAMRPDTGGLGFAGGDLAVVAAWTVAALVVAGWLVPRSTS
jgi:hypothetical protein